MPGGATVVALSDGVPDVPGDVRFNDELSHSVVVVAVELNHSVNVDFVDC